MRSPYRLLGGPSDCWRLLLAGEILRAIDADAEVLPEEVVSLPRTGRWETGLARIRPALDDALGSTAFAVAWRWASAEQGRSAWPGLTLVAQKATDRRVSPLWSPGILARADGVELATGGLTRAWVLEGGARIGVRGGGSVDWREVDRIAAIVAAWLDGALLIER
jgi:hypothetical protein